MVKIPESIAGIFNFVFKKAVTTPANAPAPNAASIAKMGLTPTVARVDIKTLQNKLEAENVMIHFPDEYVPEDKTVVIHGKNAVDIGHI